MLSSSLDSSTTNESFLDSSTQASPSPWRRTSFGNLSSSLREDGSSCRDPIEILNEVRDKLTPDQQLLVDKRREQLVEMSPLCDCRRGEERVVIAVLNIIDHRPCC